MGAAELARLDDRERKAYALRRQNPAPSLDQVLIGLADGPDIAIQIIEAERIDTAVLLTQGRVPIDLIRQRVPGESDDRNAAVADPQDIGPFLPQPIDRFIAVRRPVPGSSRCA